MKNIATQDRLEFRRFGVNGAPSFRKKFWPKTATSVAARLVMTIPTFNTEQPR